MVVTEGPKLNQIWLFHTLIIRKSSLQSFHLKMLHPVFSREIHEIRRTCVKFCIYPTLLSKSFQRLTPDKPIRAGVFDVLRFEKFESAKRSKKSFHLTSRWHIWSMFCTKHSKFESLREHSLIKETEIVIPDGSIDDVWLSNYQDWHEYLTWECWIRHVCDNHSKMIGPLA